MSTIAPLRARQSYRHEAFLWHGRADFVEGLVPFVTEGLDGGEAVMVALPPEHIGWLADELGPRASEVCFVDMVELGHNPARIIPAWQDFLDRSCGHGRPARGIGEPIWPGRGCEEIREALLHEALLNLAVDPHLPFWLVCPYDVEHLGPEVLADVGRSHPAIATSSSYVGSGSYRGQDHARALFTENLPALGSPAADVWVSERELDETAERDLAGHRQRPAVGLRPQPDRGGARAGHRQRAPGRPSGPAAALGRARGAGLRGRRPDRGRRLPHR